MDDDFKKFLETLKANKNVKVSFEYPKESCYFGSLILKVKYKNYRACRIIDDITLPYIFTVINMVIEQVKKHEKEGTIFA